MDALLRQIDQQTADLILISRRAEAEGRFSAAEEILRSAAAIIGPAVQPDQTLQARMAYGALCARLGELLKTVCDYAHAAYFFQEASDALQNTPCADYRSICAAEAVDCVRRTGRNPEVRLGLILARYEHLEHQYLMHTNRSHLAAECRAHIALSLLRAERYSEAAVNFEKAISLYRDAEELPEIRLAQASFLRRLADLRYARLNELSAAAENYKEAYDLYCLYEPDSCGRQEHKALCELALKDIADELERGT